MAKISGIDAAKIPPTSATRRLPNHGVRYNMDVKINGVLYEVKKITKKEVVLRLKAVM